MFVPIDLSVLYVRDPELLRRTFSLASDVLVTYETEVHNYMDYGLQLGRRFRALKLWFALRTYGVERDAATLARAHRARAGVRRLDRRRARLERRRAAPALGRVLPLRAGSGGAACRRSMRPT